MSVFGHLIRSEGRKRRIGRFLERRREVRAAGLRQEMIDTRLQARAWTREHGVDLPKVAE
jgi:hypothetical protein